MTRLAQVALTLLLLPLSADAQRLRGATVAAPAGLTPIATYDFSASGCAADGFEIKDDTPAKEDADTSDGLDAAMLSCDCNDTDCWPSSSPTAEYFCANVDQVTVNDDLDIQVNAANEFTDPGDEIWSCWHQWTQTNEGPDAGDSKFFTFRSNQGATDFFPSIRGENETDPTLDRMVVSAGGAGAGDTQAAATSLQLQTWQLFRAYIHQSSGGNRISQLWVESGGSWSEVEQDTVSGTSADTINGLQLSAEGQSTDHQMDICYAKVLVFDAAPAVSDCQ